MEVITTNITSPSGAPYVSFGNSSNYSSYLNGIQTTSNVKYARHIFDNPQDAISGGTVLTASILTGSTASVHSGYLLFKGILINQ